jgi:hypothetical protein
MSSKKRIAIFPVFADTLPVTRYFKRYRSDLEIVELLSPPGCCACGKDAGFLDNREQFGMVIKSPAEANPDSWDELYVLSHGVLGLEETEIQKQLYEPMLSIAKSKDKSIRLILNCAEGSEIAGMNTQKGKKQGILTPLKQYTVFVGGVIGEANSFEVFLNLYGELSKYLNVAAFSTSENAEICDITSLHSLLYERSLLETEKVFALNNAVLTKVKETNSEMVLIHVEEAMMSFSNSLTNGFGIVPYMISQIISPDFSICCLPYDCADPAFIAEFAQGLEGRFSFSPDVWHISNALLDHSVASEIQDANAIYTPVENVGSVIHRCQNTEETIGSLIEREFFMKCTADIIKDWEENQLVEILN